MNSIQNTRILGCNKECGQQVKGDDPPPLLCLGEASPGVVLSPDVESSVQERDGPAGAHPEESHKNDLRDGTPLLPGQAERAGAVHLGEGSRDFSALLYKV